MLKIALLGNPNTGKTSLFNRLTGLNQKVGNYPGVTTEKKVGFLSSNHKPWAEITDLPGLYSLTPASVDEEIVTQILTDVQNIHHPDIAVVIADATNLKRNLFLYTQVKDLGIPTLLVINMMDEASRKGISIDEKILEHRFQTPVFKVSVRKNQGIDSLAERLAEPITPTPNGTIPSRSKTHFVYKPNAKPKRLQESIYRYRAIHDVLQEALTVNRSEARDFTSRLDRILTHKFWGYAIFLLVLSLIFQAIFSWASTPMDSIDQGFTALSQWVRAVMPAGVFTELLSQGVIPGVAGVVMFVPQIAILFLLLTLLEESGYMSRVVFLLDKFMCRFGLSGKSVMPLISGLACAIPAILSARNIENARERLITIMVTPFMTCSARIPVYTILIAIVIPRKKWGVFNTQGLVLMGMYVLGVATALLAAAAFKKILKQRYKSFLIVELPPYRMPQLRNVWLNMFQKTKAFALKASQIILAISVVLWFLASYGYREETVDSAARTAYENSPHKAEGFQAFAGSYRLKHSYLGRLGRFIEPAIAPLGCDWKIGIALLASIAAREVFVGTLATVYSVRDEGDDTSIKQSLSREVRIDGSRLFNLATGVSLLLFYAFAMQCMSTIAVVRSETRSWKWPAIQFAYMTLLAYVASWLAYQILK